MGIKLFKDSSSSGSTAVPEYTVKQAKKYFAERAKSAVTPNPDPFLFEVCSRAYYGRYMAVIVHYPGCTTFGGKKVAVYDNVKAFEKAVKKGHLDPHFFEEGLSPIARFPADDKGWHRACDFALALYMAETEG